MPSEGFRGRAHQLVVVWLIAGGAVFVLLAATGLVPITNPLPFVRGEAANRVILGTMGVIALAIGIGLARQRRVAAIALVVVYSFTMCYQLAALLDAESVNRYGDVALVGGALGSAVIATGFFILYRPLIGERNTNPY